MIERYYDGRLSEADRARLFDAVEACEVCQSAFFAYQRLESALCGTDAPYTHLSVERVESALFDTKRPAPARAAGVAKRWIPAGIVSALAAVAAAVLLIGPGATGEHRTALQGDLGFRSVAITAKGAHPPSAASFIGVRLLEVSPAGQVIREEKRLALDDIITFTYTQAETGTRYLALFGLQASGEVRWYYPDYGEDKSIPVKGDRVDEPLGDGIDLSVNHQPGWLRVVALFSDAPIDVDDIETAVSALRDNPEKLKALAPLSIPASPSRLRQFSMMVEIDKGDDGGNRR